MLIGENKKWVYLNRYPIVNHIVFKKVNFSLFSYGDIRAIINISRLVTFLKKIIKRSIKQNYEK